MITIVAAIARGGAIGRAGGLPWHYPEDMAHFKALTMGTEVAMGRKTWDSLPPRFKPLPGRKNVVLTRSGCGAVPERGTGFCDPQDFTRPSVWVSAVGYLCNRAERGRDAFIIGGAEVYAQALPLADALEITEVDVDVPDADAFFPFADLFAPQRDPLVADAGWERVGKVVCPGGHPGPRFCEVSRRKGETPELTFVRWERIR